MSTPASSQELQDPAPDAGTSASQSLKVSGIALALLPILSFMLQYIFSVRAGTYQFMVHHSTVMVADWIFLPFNYLVVRSIDWRRGALIYIIASVSVITNAVTHAYWQNTGLDGGHMITKAGVILAAGWVHLAFSTLEMTLVVAFVFCRKPGVTTSVTTALASLYFVAGAICSYLMHRSFIVTDMIVFASGLFFVLVYPSLLHRHE